MTVPFPLRARRPGAPSRQAAFSLAEVMVALAIATIILGSVAAFSITGMRTIRHITVQGTMTQDIGETQGILSESVRTAIDMALSNNGNVLTLMYDENPAVDSNADKDPYNDTNRVARFFFNNGDGNDSTTTNNTFTFVRDVSITNQARVLLSRGVRKLPALPVFVSLSSNTVLQVNLGVVDDQGQNRTQNIEMKSTLVLRN